MKYEKSLPPNPYRIYVGMLTGSSGYTKLIRRIVATEYECIIAANEDEIRDPDHRKIALTEKLTAPEASARPFHEVCRTICAFLSSSRKAWSFGD